MSLSFRPIARAACFVLPCVFFLYGCGDNASAPPDLSEVRTFDAHHVYYAGDEVATLPLEDIEGGDWEGAEREAGWYFYYGDCDPPSGFFAEGGCEPPLQIHNLSTCRRWAVLLHQSADLYDLRGARAAGHGRGIEDPIEIFTGRTTVVIFASERRVADAAAQQLRDVRQARPSALPPPVPGAISGRLPCRDKAG